MIRLIYLSATNCVALHVESSFMSTSMTMDV